MFVGGSAVRWMRLAISRRLVVAPSVIVRYFIVTVWTENRNNFLYSVYLARESWKRPVQFNFRTEMIPICYLTHQENCSFSSFTPRCYAIPVLLSYVSPVVE